MVRGGGRSIGNIYQRESSEGLMGLGYQKE